jgi:ADP-ribose pyrophosphatase
VRHEGSIVLIPISADGRILLVRQYRHAVERFLWELPAGSLETNEDLAAAAARECQEELGLVADNLERLHTFFPTPGFCTEAMTYFKATGLRTPGAGDPVAHQDDDESIEVGSFSTAEVRQMIDAAEIADLKTVAALFLLS